jgi:GT2 family glycosyltransferase
MPATASIGLPEGEGGPFGSVDWYRNFSAVTGACMMMRKDTSLNSLVVLMKDTILAFSDIELCMRVLDAGFRVMYTPFARLIHYEGRTRARHIPVRTISNELMTNSKIGWHGETLTTTLIYLIRYAHRPCAAPTSPIRLRRLEKIVSFQHMMTILVGYHPIIKIWCSLDADSSEPDLSIWTRVASPA